MHTPTFHFNFRDVEIITITTTHVQFHLGAAQQLNSELVFVINKFS